MAAQGTASAGADSGGGGGGKRKFSKNFSPPWKDRGRGSVRFPEERQKTEETLQLEL